MHVIAAKNNTINVIAAIIADAYSAGQASGRRWLVPLN